MGVFNRGQFERPLAATAATTTTTTARTIRRRPPIAHRIHRPRDLTSLPVAPPATARNGLTSRDSSSVSVMSSPTA